VKLPRRDGHESHEDLQACRRYLHLRAAEVKGEAAYLNIVLHSAHCDSEREAGMLQALGAKDKQRVATLLPLGRCCEQLAFGDMRPSISNMLGRSNGNAHTTTCINHIRIFLVSPSPRPSPAV